MAEKTREMAQQSSSQSKFKIKVNVVDKEKGMQEIDNVRMVRVYASDHTILVMEDYMPVLGAVDKVVEIVREKDTVKFENIKGYYMHKKNEFYLLIEEYY